MGLPLSLIGNIIITCSPVPCIWFLPHCFQVAFSSNTNITISFASLRCLCFPTGKSEGPALCMARKVLWYSATLNYLTTPSSFPFSWLYTCPHFHPVAWLPFTWMSSHGPDFITCAPWDLCTPIVPLSGLPLGNSYPVVVSLSVFPLWTLYSVWVGPCLFRPCPQC